MKRENAAAAGRLFQQKEKNLQKTKGFSHFCRIYKIARFFPVLQAGRRRH